MFAIEAMVPLLVFYGTWKATGLTAAIVASAAVCASIVVWQLRRGHEVAIAVATLVFVGIQATVALAAGSATVYLAQPVVLSALWGAALFGSAAIGRPLVGVFANAWYPFPPAFRRSRPYRREFGLQSVVWGVYCLSRAGLRLAMLLSSGVGSFVAISVLTGFPVFVLLVAWGTWHARRTFGSLAPLAASYPPARNEENEPKPRAGGRGFGSCDASTGHAGD